MQGQEQSESIRKTKYNSLNEKIQVIWLPQCLSTIQVVPTLETISNSKIRGGIAVFRVRKTPGPDGILTEALKAAWAVVPKYVVGVFNELLHEISRVEESFIWY